MGKNTKTRLLSSDMWMRTYKGHKFRPFKPDKQVIDIEDIAHSLSNQCRFVGMTSEFYSVAQHSFHVSYAVPPELALDGLLHDSAEAYLGDMATPIKRHKKMKFYSFCEGRIYRKIAEKFGIPAQISPEVKAADLLLLATEARDLIGSPIWARGLEKLPTIIMPWPPKVAERRFLERFKELYGI